ncbi:hypothetical protein Taro_019090 [Colocasia esculenta]|uniref:DUF3741 domain-containing protein n=1 Tax=Colocasia esculenta TaxID=4460 RepID=A0A843UT20_COLES|nr:hypothetical protein [Colocasia esculenta]
MGVDFSVRSFRGQHGTSSSPPHTTTTKATHRIPPHSTGVPSYSSGLSLTSLRLLLLRSVLRFCPEVVRGRSCEAAKVTESRKMLMSKRHTDGLEAPRNSLELTTETSKCYHLVHENIPFSLQVAQHPIKQHFRHPAGVTMKKLIDKEISSNTTRHSAPSVVARLMGMDALPSEGKQMIQSNDPRNKNLRQYLPREGIAEEASTRYKQVGVMSFKQKKQQLFEFGIKQDNNVSSRHPRLAKPQRREHPQEELLQKFKKEFEAWQSAKVWERSRAVGLGDNHLKERNNRTPALDHFEKQKKHLSANTERNPSHRESAGFLTSSAATLRTERCSIQHEGYMSKEDLSRLRETINSRNRTKFRDSVQYSELKFNKRQDRSSSPTKIVILKPSTERTEDIEESWPSPTGILDREGSIEHFLEEVRERLRLEIQGKARNEIQTSICSDEIPFSEKLSDPKQIAQHIAKQIRESVTRDLGTTLLRSESTRSYRSESQPSGPDSPEFIDRNTRKLLGERLRNVLRNEADVGFDTASNGKLRPSIDNERIMLGQLADSPTLGKSNYPEDLTGVTEMTTMSFREEQVDNVGCSAGDLTPRNLVRSLSAPVSGTAFGKLLLEDQSLLPGVHVQSKHESTENTSVEVRKMSKDVFNFKGRVSNLRHNLTLRGKLFGRKMQSADESTEKILDSMNCVATSPPIENSTEVPPSPASVSSSSFDELCKPSHPSPVSPLEMPFTEDNPSLEVSGEIRTLPAVSAAAVASFFIPE